MSNSYIESLKKRRTQYALGKTLPSPGLRRRTDPRSHQAFAIVIQLPELARSCAVWRRKRQGLEHRQEVLHKIVPADAFAQTEAKLDSFAAGAGTVLFFEDQNVVKGLQENFALYADNFPVWSEQAGGMAQLSVWSALANAGIGASLQHYNPLIDAEVAKTRNIPASWKLRAQMPFGSNEQPFGEKAFMDDADRFKVFG